MASREPDGAVAGVVVAAGASTRLGGGSKALLSLDGVPAVTRLLTTLRRAGVARLGVVVGAEVEGVRTAVAGAGAELIEHAAWRTGRTGSVQAGLAWAASAPAAVVAPVDHPFVRSATVASLLKRALEDPMAVWVEPTWEGRGGHPVWIRRSAFAQVQALATDEPLHLVPRRLGAGRLRVPVDDPGVRLGTDTLEEAHASLEAFHERFGAGEVGWTGV